MNKDARDKVIVIIIATCLRSEKLERALLSVLWQTRLPDLLIVTSDSRQAVRRSRAISKGGHGSRASRALGNKLDSELELVSRMQRLASSRGTKLLYLDHEGLGAHSGAGYYAANLNFAICTMLKELLKASPSYSLPTRLEDIYISLLDDDDFYKLSYIADCYDATKDGTYDYVISGLRYMGYKRGSQQGNRGRDPSIKGTLEVADFLRGNPHLQGSNTFVRLSTLLRAGLFDEALASCVDRDIFIRIIEVGATSCINTKSRVNIDIGEHDRVTTNGEKKLAGLGYFYYKYRALMSEEIEAAFFTRNKRLFNIGEDEIRARCERYKLAMPSTEPLLAQKSSTHATMSVPVAFAFIITAFRLGLRLVDELASKLRESDSVLVLCNFTDDIAPLKAALSTLPCPYHLLTHADIVKLGHPYIQQSYLCQEVYKDIAEARSILQYAALRLCRQEVIYVLDEDMCLSYLGREGLHDIAREELDTIIHSAYATLDDTTPSPSQTTPRALVGAYSLDAPLPLLSTLRSSLIDRHYIALANKDEGMYTSAPVHPQYYYDLLGGIHLEYPHSIGRYIECELADVFSQKASYRPLIFNPHLAARDNDKARLVRGGIRCF